MTKTKREYPCDDWWWIDPELGGNPSKVKNRTTRSLEKGIESLKFAMKWTDYNSEECIRYNQLYNDQRRLDLLCEELEDRKINPREGDIF